MGVQGAHGGQRPLGSRLYGPCVGPVFGGLHRLHGVSRAGQKGYHPNVPLDLCGVDRLGEEGLGAGADRRRQIGGQTLQDRCGALRRRGRRDVVFSGHDRKVRPERAPLIRSSKNSSSCCFNAFLYSQTGE
jgi:hypothetical protein